MRGIAPEPAGWRAPSPRGSGSWDPRALAPRLWAVHRQARISLSESDWAWSRCPIWEPRKYCHCVPCSAPDWHEPVHCPVASRVSLWPPWTVAHQAPLSAVLSLTFEVRAVETVEKRTVGVSTRRCLSWAIREYRLGSKALYFRKVPQIVWYL